jgi:multidrug efflux pump subunit AcrB
MAHGKSDEERIRSTRNTARFFVETRQLAWVVLAATLAWGVYGYLTMPQRKDPDIPLRVAAAIVPWPGASAETLEALVTRKVEEAIAGNAWIEHVTATTRTGVAIVSITLQETTPDVPKQLDDIAQRLAAVRDLPEGAGPIQYLKDFGDTAALLLTVASPRVGEVELSLRAREIRRVLERTRAGVAAGAHLTLVYGFPPEIRLDAVRPLAVQFARHAEASGVLRGAKVVDGAGFVLVDGESEQDEAALSTLAARFVRERLRTSELHPDVWGPVVFRDEAQLEGRLAAAAGDKYSYRELDDLTRLMKRTLEAVPSVSKVTRSGVLDERVYLVYSQERLAQYGVNPGALSDVLRARNVQARGGVLEVGDRALQVSPSGEFRSEREIRDVLVPGGDAPGAYLRDLADVVRAYDSPPAFLNTFTRRLPDGRWERTRAITLAVQMRSGLQIERFGRDVDAALADLRTRLPEDLVLARTSDQPLQVRENIDLFMSSLWEAVFLVVLVSIVGFWEWRSALLMALAIPITLAMTFGMMRVVGMDLQQISIAALILALGLLVDDPVVAGDAVKRELAGGKSRLVAAWLGPTKLATAILFATLTNIIAYVPFLMLSGDTGKFLYSLPVVIGCSLVASRVVSMTFIPLLGYHLLRPKTERSIEERRRSGFAAWYFRLGTWAIAHRWRVLGASLVFLLLGGVMFSRLKTQYFPKDLQYLSWVDVWLPEDVPLSATGEAAREVEAVIRGVADEMGKERASHGEPQEVLVSLTTFVGGGGPRFWISASPEQTQLNYAQIILLARDKHLTSALIDPVQRAVSERIPGATIDVRQLESSGGIGIPIAIRISGAEIATLRRLAEEAKAIVRSTPGATRIRDDWGAETFSVQLRTDPDRANAAGITNQDVAGASSSALSGAHVGTLREGEKQIPIVARMRMEERARLEDLRNLYVYSQDGKSKVPVGLVANVGYALQTERIQRRDKFRTVTVGAYPAEGFLASEVLSPMMPRLKAFQQALPPGYRMEIGGEHEKQVEGFGELALVMAISVAGIFLALLVQFKNAVKPLLVFAAIPYGTVGAIAALWLAGQPFGFMAFLGIASLVGVIVSHVIVLFDFIEEAHAHGEPFEQALLDAGILRLRPVMITVGATVIALVPLAAHGGPLWEGLCYAQMGGLIVATAVTLVLVPVIYTIVVRDLRWIRWETAAAPEERTPVADVAAMASAGEGTGESGDGEREPDGASAVPVPRRPGRPPAPWAQPGNPHGGSRR